MFLGFLHIRVFPWHHLSCQSSRVRFLFRPGVPGAPLPGRAILSMNGLSYGVIRVNTEDKNSALTVQDVGHVMPGGELEEDPWRGKNPATAEVRSQDSPLQCLAMGLVVMAWPSSRETRTV